MTDDAVLSREAAYIYQNATGFEPIGGDLTRWRGPVRDSSNQTTEMLVKIPDSFPDRPPLLELTGNTDHPLVNEDGNVTTRSINRWNANMHVYSVIREAVQALKSAPFSSASKMSLDRESDLLSNQVEMLKSQLSQKRREYAELKNATQQQVKQQHSVDEVIESSLIDIENELFALENSYDNLEIKAIDFAREFIDLRKRYYRIQEAKTMA